MTITANLKRAHEQLARVMPHGDAFTVAVPGVETEDEYGNVTPGTPAQSAPAPCKADRLSADDATKAGLSSSAEVWQITTNSLLPAVTPSSILTVTLPDARTFSIAARRVAGTSRQVITGEVV